MREARSTYECPGCGGPIRTGDPIASLRFDGGFRWVCAYCAPVDRAEGRHVPPAPLPAARPADPPKVYEIDYAAIARVRAADEANMAKDAALRRAAR